ncbi:hypothetical protein ACFV2U_21360 [Streptomyces sp. NPDC059697]|uniref:hypothetical protein n=1 Tax=Streptomyces sp. NPDC059697 TaxID=3346912 RepID=UPI0036B9698A
MATSDERDEGVEGVEELPEGTLVKDTARNKDGVVMGHVGPAYQLRPLNGGREWDADPGVVRRLTAREEMSARLAVQNNVSAAGRFR